MPLAGAAPVFAELSRIKFVIGIKCPKVKYFPEIGSRQGNPASHTPKMTVGSGRSLRSRRWGNGFLLMPPEFAGLYKKEENILRRPGHDKMKQPRDVNRPGASLGLKGRQPGDNRLMLWSSRTDIFS
jgi:hypothetical protein